MYKNRTDAMRWEEISDRIHHFFEFPPTHSQVCVIDSVAKFLAKESDHSIYILKGYAGTGKSTLVGALSRAAGAMGIPVTLLAPTGRAAKVLQSYCGMPASTIHRTIYRERIGGGGRASYEMGYNRDKVHSLYIIDEASMINHFSDGPSPFGSGNLLEDLLEFCFSVEGGKVLFVGDDAQLPPVGCEESPAMSEEFLSYYSSEVYSGTLTEIVRQEEASEIILLSHVLRGHIKTLSEGGELPSILLPRPQSREVQIVSPRELPELVESSYDRVGIEETVLITRSNREAEEFNRQIRRQTLYYEDEIVQGEPLMICRNNYLHYPTDEEGRRKSTFIANGEILHVQRTRREEKEHGFHFREAELTDSEGGYVNGKIILESLYSGVASLTTEHREALFESVSRDYPEATSRAALFQAVRKDPFLNALQVKYAYAMTCHKSQGGQWEEVYLSFGYLTPEMIDINFLRWFYTAMTRASERLYIISPPEFIFGEIQEDW